MSPTQDMQAILARYRAHLEPRGTRGEATYAREAHAASYADDAHAFLPGTWFMAGHHTGRGEIDAMWAAVRKIWPRGTRLFRNHFFVGEDTIAVEWWSRNEVWNGVQAQNSGVGRLRFRDGQVIDHHEITDSEYFEEVHAGWRVCLGRELGRHLPRWGDRRPFYPDPARNDWACEHSPTDGSAQVSEDLRPALEAARACFAGGSCPPEVFADDVDVFFQGRLWPLGGHHRGRAGLQRVVQTAHLLWPHTRVVRANYWAGDGRVLVEWFREMETWTGRACREGGFTVLHWQDGRIASVRTYVDTSFHAEVLDGWREVVGEQIGRALPCWEPPGRPRYPRPAQHE